MPQKEHRFVLLQGSVGYAKLQNSVAFLIVIQQAIFLPRLKDKEWFERLTELPDLEGNRLVDVRSMICPMRFLILL